MPAIAPTSPDHPPLAEEARTRTLMRSGTAARLAGVSASTLRIWEHRYGVVSPPKSASGQRTYSMADIQRLRLIKRLTLEGHAIGSVAHLDADALVALTSDHQAAASQSLRVVVVGHGAARKLDGRLHPAPVAVLEDLAEAERSAGRCGSVDVLVVHLPSLHPALSERVLALRSSLAAARVIVVYSFGAEPVADLLRADGLTLRREPVTGKELARLITASKPAPPPSPLADTVRAHPRQYSDADLVSLAEMPSDVLCECPRHLAEIVTLLVAFEHYSAECASRSPEDVALHRHLQDVTGAARSMLEQALTRVVIEEGLTLQGRGG